MNERIWLAALALHAVGLTSCAGGTETDNPLIDFDSSTCKTHASDSALTLQSEAPVASALTMDSSELDGLHCYGWTLSDGGRLRIDITNMQGGCSVEWIGRSEVTSDGVALIAENSRCAVAGCGWCIYDLTFALDGIDPKKPLAVALGQDGNCDKVEPISNVVLPLPEQRQGVVCRPALKYAVLPDAVRCSAELHKPCITREEHDASESKYCESFCEDNGLVCADLVADDLRCLQPCESNDDCPLGELMSCQDGLCRLAHPF